MSKFSDLNERVYQEAGGSHFRRDIIRGVLRWLDENPDQMPGRTAKPTVTVSEVTDEAGTAHADLVIRCIEYMDLATVVPDEETTNAGHDRDWWIENANVNDAEDCEACEGDLCPVHHGMAVGIELMARKIAALGADPEMFALIPDPVNTPGGDDE